MEKIQKYSKIYQNAEKQSKWDLQSTFTCDASDKNAKYVFGKTQQVQVQLKFQKSKIDSTTKSWDSTLLVANPAAKILNKLAK